VSASGEIRWPSTGRFSWPPSSDAAELKAVAAHLAHCRVCRQAQARMRDYLIDVANGTLLASSLGPERAPAAPAQLLELASRGAQALGEAGRAARERAREAVLKLAGALPGPGADAGVSQALGASSWRVASACTATIAAGACVAAGVVPGVGGVGLTGHHRHQAAPAAKQARAGSAPQVGGPPEYTAPAATASGAASAGTSAKRKAGSASREESSIAAPATGRQVATEFGPESGQPAPSSGTSSGASQETSVSDGSAAKSGGGSTSTGKSSSEFGL